MKKSFLKCLILIAVLAMAFTVTACSEGDYDPLDDSLIVMVTISTPAQQSFALGEAFNSDDLEFEATYANGQKRYFMDEGYIINSSSYNASVEGFYEIEVEFKVTGEQFTYMVTVGNPSVVPVSMSIKRVPTATTYYIGEAFNATGLEVMAQFNNKTVGDLTSADYTIDDSAFDSTTEGNYTIRVELVSNPTIFATFIVKVTKEPASINVRQLGETEFFVGTSFNYTSLIVEAEFIDSTKADLQRTAYNIDFSDYESKKNIGGSTATIVISLKENPLITTSYTVQIFEAHEIFLAHLSNTTHAIGERTINFNAIISARYGTNNKTVILSSSAYTLTAQNYDVNVAGNRTITAKYNRIPSLTATFNITYAEPDYITATAPLKTQFLIGQALDTYGLRVYAHFANGDRHVLSEELYSLSHTYQSNVAGPYNIYVVLNSNPTLQDSFMVNVCQADYIRLATTSSQPTVFAYGDSFDYHGLVVEAVYGPGLSTVVSPINYTVNYSAFKRISAGTYPITVELNSSLGGGLTVTYMVDILPYVDAVDGIEIDYDSAHETKFNIGEAFTTSGLRLYSYKGDQQKGLKNALALSRVNVDSTAFDNTTAGVYPITLSLIDDPSITRTYNVEVVTSDKILVRFKSRFTSSRYITRATMVATESTSMSNAINGDNYGRIFSYKGYETMGVYLDENYNQEVDPSLTVGDYTLTNELVLYVNYETNFNYNWKINVYSSYNSSFENIYGLFNYEYLDSGLIFGDYFGLTVTDTGVYTIGGMGVSIYASGIVGYSPVRIFKYSGDHKNPIDVGNEISCTNASGDYVGFTLTNGVQYVLTFDRQYYINYSFCPIVIDKAVSIDIVLSDDVKAVVDSEDLTVLVCKSLNIDKILFDLFANSAEVLGSRFEFFTDPTFTTVVNYNVVVTPNATYYMDIVPSV